MFARVATTATTASRRSYATVARGSLVQPAPSPYIVFDREAKRAQRDRAAAANGGERSRTVDYVRAEIAERLLERFMARLIRVLPFILVLSLACTCRMFGTSSTTFWTWAPAPVTFLSFSNLEWPTRSSCSTPVVSPDFEHESQLLDRSE